MPQSIEACGVNEEDFMSKVHQMAENAFEDQCTTANPRYPLIKDLEAIYIKAYRTEV
jgi:acetaldehyde dehydrogenase/alcohol dehydrogenase